ncbi:MAG: MCE family protein [Verrucomicrobiota bacterium]|nr:MCE family protein [Verrucomicrobiota bacterium]
MALQDLTPQLRTRLNRMERAVGWFVFLATLLLLLGFGDYVYHVAKQKGWFVIKAKFHTYLKSSEGLDPGDPIYMMGFQVGQITSVHPLQPRDPHNVEVVLEIRDPFFRYIWTEGSVAKVNSTGFLNERRLEVTRATNGYALCVTQPVTDFTNLAELEQLAVAAPGHWQLAQDVFDGHSNLLFRAYTMLDKTNLQRIAELKPAFICAYDNTVNRDRVVAAWHRRDHRYEAFTPEKDSVWLKAVEAPNITAQLQTMVAQAQRALPNVLALTNQIAAAFRNTANAASNLNQTALAARPALTNLAVVSAQLREPGGLGVWALGAGGQQQLQQALTNAGTLLAHTDTNLTATLLNLADLTSNLSAQVQANSNLLGGVSKTVLDADDFIQGLKHHWLLRSAFRKENEKTNAPPRPVLLPPRMRGARIVP